MRNDRQFMKKLIIISVSNNFYLQFETRWIICLQIESLEPLFRWNTFGISN